MIYRKAKEFERKYGVKLIELVGHIAEIDGLNVYADLILVYKKYGKDRAHEYLARFPLRAFRGRRIGCGSIFKVVDGKITQTPCKPHVRRMIKARAAKRADLFLEKFIP